MKMNPECSTKADQIISYLLPGSPDYSYGIHSNSVAYSKSFYSNCVDSLQQMSDVPSLQLIPRGKSNILMTKPWLNFHFLQNI